MNMNLMWFVLVEPGPVGTATVPAGSALDCLSSVSCKVAAPWVRLVFPAHSPQVSDAYAV